MPTQTIRKTSVRYFLAADNSGHWYFVPDKYRNQWDGWVDLDEDDENSWEAPPFAIRLTGSLSDVTFTAPKGY